MPICDLSGINHWNQHQYMNSTHHFSFSQTHKVGNVGIYCQLCVTIFVQFSSLFSPNDARKCEIRNQWQSKKLAMLQCGSL